MRALVLLLPALAACGGSRTEAAPAVDRAPSVGTIVMTCAGIDHSGYASSTAVTFWSGRTRLM